MKLIRWDIISVGRFGSIHAPAISDRYSSLLVALAAGKHVVLEKPMVASAAECLALVKAAESSMG